MFHRDPTAEELAAEAREALRKNPPPEGREYFIWLVREGIINSRGQPTRLIGCSGELDPDYQNWTQEKQDAANAARLEESQNGRKKKSSPRKSRSRKSPG